jgi:tRNA pseudouridine13 synthase
MKLKQRPDDFQVEELTEITPETAGAFSFYRLEKQGMGTPEAVQAICRKWKLELRQISYGGLKDRHAVTQQFLTIWHGPRRGFRQQHLALHYLGQLSRPFDPDLVRGNRFRIVLRDLSPLAVRFAETALREVALDGVANYFDDQRFGSVGPRGEFVARKLIDGDYEGALRLALVEPYEFDRAAQKDEKRILRECWSDWATAKSRLARGHARSLVTYLVDHPTDFRGAFARLRADLKSLYLAAYQSHLWNRVLARWIEDHCRPEQLATIQLRLGQYPMFRYLDDAQRQVFRAQLLPLPSARLKFAADDPLRPVYDEVLRAEGLELGQMKLKHLREPFFAKGERAVVLSAQALQHTVEADELHEHRQKLVLRFVLPRGSYATMLVKRITAVSAA